MALLVRGEDERIEVCDADLDGVEDGDAETVYTVRVLTQRVIDELRAKHTKQIVNRTTHRREPVTDDRAFAEDLLDYLVLDWRGIVFKATRQPVPCTREFKISALSGARVEALFKLAGVNETERADARAASFRPVAGVD